MTVIIYGATPAGLLSAIAAARKGKTVQIIAPEYHIGCMVTGGLGATDVANTDTIGGISKEFLKRRFNSVIEICLEVSDTEPRSAVTVSLVKGFGFFLSFVRVAINSSAGI